MSDSQTSSLREYLDFAILAAKAANNARLKMFAPSREQQALETHKKWEPFLGSRSGCIGVGIGGIVHETGGFHGRDLIDFDDRTEKERRKDKEQAELFEEKRKAEHPVLHAAWLAEYDTIINRIKSAEKEYATLQAFADSFKDELAKKLDAVVAAGVSELEISKVQAEIEFAKHSHYYYNLFKEDKKALSHEELVVKSEAAAEKQIRYVAEQKRLAAENLAYLARKSQNQSQRRGNQKQGYQKQGYRKPSTNQQSQGYQAKAPAAPAAPVVKAQAVKAPMCSAGFKCLDGGCSNSHPAGYSLKVAQGAAKLREEKAARAVAASATN
jgi:hypothetical protein